MDIEIDEFTSELRAADGAELLDRATLARVVAAVLRAIDARDEARGNAEAERRISRGVSREQREGG